MMPCQSRREKREEKMLITAKRGFFESNSFLFKREELGLVKQGFFVQRYGENLQKSLPSLISWEKAFPHGIPMNVLAYIHFKKDTLPKNLNFAQELYAIAARANYSVIFEE